MWWYDKSGHVYRKIDPATLAINLVPHVLPTSDIDGQSAILSSTEISDSDRRLD